ncbi:unnamed protein product [Clonostachys chloroleuca]|uniref:Uncharacterized protein n=1 Tax=Clonostachys chloroleuca TaxID=1926264 RepID=A0AA35LS29_9HYPO|nr:unnamed protein product [Clonostachys chloroleuca]
MQRLGLSPSALATLSHRCRYLFVKVGEAVPMIDTPIVSRNSLGYLRQDADRKLHGNGEKLSSSDALRAKASPITSRSRRELGMARGEKTSRESAFRRFLFHCTANEESEPVLRLICLCSIFSTAEFTLSTYPVITAERDRRYKNYLEFLAKLFESKLPEYREELNWNYGVLVAPFSANRITGADVYMATLRS